jgi:hypothetical protein
VKAARAAEYDLASTVPASTPLQDVAEQRSEQEAGDVVGVCVGWDPPSGLLDADHAGDGAAHLREPALNSSRNWGLRSTSAQTWCAM